MSRSGKRPHFRFGLSAALCQCRRKVGSKLAKIRPTDLTLLYVSNRSTAETLQSTCATSSNIHLGAVDFAEETFPRSNICSERRRGYLKQRSSQKRLSTSTFPKTSKATCKSSDLHIGDVCSAMPARLLRRPSQHQYAHRVECTVRRVASGQFRLLLHVIRDCGSRPLKPRK